MDFYINVTFETKSFFNPLILNGLEMYSYTQLYTFVIVPISKTDCLLFIHYTYHYN